MFLAIELTEMVTAFRLHAFVTHSVPTYEVMINYDYED